MTDTDRLAALLYGVSVEAYEQRRWAQAPWPLDLYDWIAARLVAAGVTLAPQPDTASRELDVERLREAVRHVMRDSTVRAGGPYASLTSTMYVVTLDHEAYAAAIAREYAALAATEADPPALNIAPHACNPTQCPGHREAEG